MPTYEYRCPNGHDFERFYKTISGAPTEVKCPECDAVAERILSGGGGLVFKGAGFYLTDYGKNAHRKPAAEAKSDGSKSESAPAKPDAKSESKSDSAPKAEPSKPKADAPKP